MPSDLFFLDLVQYTCFSSQRTSNAYTFLKIFPVIMKTIFKLILGLLFLQLIDALNNSLAYSARSCPPKCACFWKSGKKSVECNNSSLTRIPSDIDVDVQSLDLTGNKIHVLVDKAFFDVGLVDLQK